MLSVSLPRVAMAMTTLLTLASMFGAVRYAIVKEYVHNIWPHCLRLQKCMTWQSLAFELGTLEKSVDSN